MKFTDIHCHLLPYVDDGASNLEESIELLREQAEQGVTTICLTPHFRSDMFETSDEEVRSQFDRIQTVIRKEQIPVSVMLGREYYCNAEFKKLIQNRNVIPLGPSNVVLIEFSSSVSMNELVEVLRMTQEHGYRALFAHVERYKTIRDFPESAGILAKRGALLQVNASSILGQETKELKETTRRLLKQQLVFAVASDSHRMEFRAPNLKKCAKSLKWTISRDYLEKIFYDNPLSILQEQ